ncbi:MAG: beta-propeller domain-containing protein [Filifactoraceae bacterium]
MKNLKRIFCFVVLSTIMLTPLQSIAMNNVTPLTFSSKAELEKYLSGFKSEYTSRKQIYTEDSINQTSTSKNEDSSKTNVQVEGVDEGELLKNFENHIYYAKNEKISIVNANQGKLTLVSEIKGQGLNYQELYTMKNKLIAISTQYVPENNKTETLAQIYDTTDLKKPKLSRSISVEGSLLQGRMIEDKLYIISNKNIPYYGVLDDMMPPVLKDSNEPNLKEISATSIRYYPNVSPESYTNILSVSVNGSEKINIESILGDSQEMYMSTKNLYITSSDYKATTPSTLITKYTINGSKVNFSKTATIPGTLLDQFSMDEYKDNLRVATNINSWNEKGNQNSNSLFILDNNMNTVGKIENIASEEKIYSVRFQEEKGYIVTFREVDPLFTLDLTKPTNPKLLGQLKVPGYSSYMHILPNNMVLGIGRDMQEMYIKDRNGKEVSIGNREGGIKLSIFDVNNPFKPKEKDTLVLGGAGSYSNALTNHKALMINPSKNDFGLCVELTSDNNNSPIFNGAVIINTSNGKLSQKGTITEASTEVYYENNARLTYIGNYIYYVTSGQISSFKYDTLSPVSKLKI